MEFAYRLEPDYYENEETDLEEVDQLLSKSTKDKKNRIKKQIQKIKKEIRNRDNIKGGRKEKLENQIQKQENRLKKSQRPSNPSESQIRDRLEQLYIEKRELPRNKWLDTQKLKERKWELERQIQKLDDSEKFDELLDFL